MTIVLWKASNGREFTIDTEKEGINTETELMNYIQKLREELGLPAPDYMAVPMVKPTAEKFVSSDTPHIDDIPVDPKLKQEMKNDILAALAKPDPKTLN